MAKKYLDDTGLGHFWDKTAYKYGIEYIVGTQAAATNVWTGVTLDKNCASSTIPTGKVIVYHLPYAGNNSAATLNLTLPDGTTTGAKNVRSNASSSVTTHYGAGCDIFMVFDGTYWKCSSWYDSNNYDRIRHNTNVKAASAVTAGQIIVGTDAGYKPVANGVTFSINYPILYAGSAITAAATGNNNYDAYPGVNLQGTKSGYTGTTYKMVFLVGTLSGTTFTVNSDIFTQTIPSSADSKVYAPIGLMTDSNKTVYFFPTNNYWEYRNGAFRPISTCPTLATVATSGSYNDLSNKPTIPTVNNATLTIQKNGTTVNTFTANASSNATANITVPTKTSDLTNDSNFATTTDLAAKVDVASINLTGQTTTILAQVQALAGTKNYARFICASDGGSANISDNPNAGKGFVCVAYQSRGSSSSDYAYEVICYSNDGASKPYYARVIHSTTSITWKRLQDVAFSGSYNDLSNKPTIPTVNNATLTIQKNGSTVKTFTANASSNVTANITVPTNNNELTNGAGYITSSGSITGNAATATNATNDSDGNAINTTYLKKSGGAMTGAITRALASSGTIADTNLFTVTGSTDGFGVNYASTTADTGVTTLYTTDDANAKLSLGNKVSSTYKEAISIVDGTATVTGSVSGNAGTATKLAAGKTIALGTGATGTATSFDGSANITIPVTDVKDAYVTWGGKGIVNDITPDDMGCTDEFGHNKLAYLPASCINVAYSTDGGSSWTDYGATDAEKVKMVTTSGPGFGVGKNTEATSSNIANLKLRIRLACGTVEGVGKIYTAAKKVLFNVNAQGAASKVHMRYRTIANYKAGTETWTDISTEYTVGGGSGWNSIPFAYTFGGNMSTQTGQIGEFEFVFSCTSLGTWGGKKLVVYDIRMIGATNWTMPSEMARAGHLYTVDEGQNATFPANVSVTGSLKHGSYTYTLPNKTGTVAMTSDLPTVNNATLTIQKNGTNVQTFTANQSTNATANITVPTKTSELTNNSGFLTSIPTASASTLGGVKVGTNLSIDANGVLSADAQSITVDTALSTTSTNPVQNKVITTALNSKADSSSVPTKISNLTNTSGSFITYCTCSTAAATAAKVVALDSGDSNWVLRKGAIIGVKFTNTNTASSVTLNVNSSGAKSIYYNNAAYTGSSNSICGYASRYTFYMYDGTYWVWISDGRHDGNDNTYTTAYCSTAAGTAAKAASMTGYTLTANRYTVITFTNANSSASALTLNINSKGAKPLYINGTASSATNYTLAAGSYIVYYDGTNYYINNNGEIPRMIHSESPVSTSSVTPIVTNSMISDGTITFSKTATGEFLKLTLTTTDPGVGSALAANTLLGVYEA